MRKATYWISVVLIAGTAVVSFAKRPYGVGGRGVSSAERVRPFSPMIGRGGMHGLGPEQSLMFLLSRPALAEKAGLTKEEISSLRTMMFEHRSEMIDLDAKAERAQLALEKAKTADSPDLAAVEKAIDEVHSIHAEIEKAMFRHQQAIRSIIRDERLEEIRSQAIKAASELRAERRDMGEMRREFHRKSWRKANRGLCRGMMRRAWGFDGEGDDASDMESQEGEADKD